MSQAEENYLKAIFTLQSESNKIISTNLLAKKIATKPSSVTDMLKKFAAKKFVDYKKYKGVKLTAYGLLTAKMIVRKHRLWETFLVNKLDFNWDEVHEIAEQLEHIKSDKLISKLDAFLGHPKQDPHGDPIPDAKGKIALLNQDVLAKMAINKSYILTAVKDSSPAFLNFLTAKNIGLGTKISISQIEPFNQSMLIKVNNTSLTITASIANNLIVTSAL